MANILEVESVVREIRIRHKYLLAFILRVAVTDNL